MSYIKAEKILPDELIRQIQLYVDGAYIYIPRKPGGRKAWGQGTGYREELRCRNRMICSDHAAGCSVEQLARKYHLSERSIHRILQDP